MVLEKSLFKIELNSSSTFEIRSSIISSTIIFKDMDASFPKLSTAVIVTRYSLLRSVSLGFSKSVTF